MQRMLVIVLAAFLAAAPSVSTMLVMGGNAGMPCCKPELSASHCPQPGARLSCCSTDEATPPAGPVPVGSPTPGARADQTAPVLLPDAPGPAIALVASRSFASWPGSALGPPPHLVLGVFRI